MCTVCGDQESLFVCAGTDAPAIVNCLHILARSLDARLVFITRTDSYVFLCIIYHNLKILLH